jgi:hypothetical protein
MSADLTLFVAFLAALGIGSVTAAIVGWFSAISRYRQEWINALRDDISELFKQVQIYSLPLTGPMGIVTKEREKQKEEAKFNAEFCLRRIQLRLNTTEKLHKDLNSQLRDFVVSSGYSVDMLKAETAARTAQELLKDEWSATKYPVFRERIERYRGKRKKRVNP